MTKAEIEQLKKESENTTVLRGLKDGKEITIPYSEITDKADKMEKTYKEILKVKEEIDVKLEKVGNLLSKFTELFKEEEK